MPLFKRGHKGSFYHLVTGCGMPYITHTKVLMIRKYHLFFLLKSKYNGVPAKKVGTQ